jgi:hypothetical protein
MYIETRLYNTEYYAVIAFYGHLFCYDQLSYCARIKKHVLRKLLQHDYHFIIYINNFSERED